MRKKNTKEEKELLGANFIEEKHLYWIRVAEMLLNAVGKEKKMISEPYDKFEYEELEKDLSSVIDRLEDLGRIRERNIGDIKEGVLKRWLKY